MPDQQHFLSNYNTKLTPEQELAFTQWVDQISKQSNRNRIQDLNNYDLKGYFMNGGNQDYSGGHMPDTYKKPNHPTFSDQSIYHNTPNPDGGMYQGGSWGQDSFSPSPWNLQNMPAQNLQQYFSIAEPNTKLVLPQQ